MATSGYVPCACRDCMDVAIADDDMDLGGLCNECFDADCDATGAAECCRCEPDPDACPDCGGGDFHYRGCPSQL